MNRERRQVKEEGREHISRKGIEKKEKEVT
jgi:hypothetical protein